MSTINFDQLTKAEQRVAVAKDVLLQLKKKNYIAKKGAYVEVKKGRRSLPVKDNIDKTVCKVCALGSCLLSIAKFKNTITFNDAERGLSSWDSTDPSKRLLTSIFTRKQINLMENAFEGVVYFMHEPFTGTDKKADRFYDQYDKDNQRLIAIMENIIKNLGTFKP